MKLQNLTLATAILLALTGCGSSGGGSGAPQNKPTVQDEQTQKQVEDAKKAKEAAEQKAIEAQKAQAAAEQKAEDARQAQTEAEQKVKDAQEALVAEKQKAEEVQKAEEAKKTKYEKLFDLARRIGLDKGTSHEFANANLDTAESELLSALNKTIQQDQAEKQKQGIDQLKGISSDEYPQGKIISEDIYQVTEANNDYVVKKVQRKMLYNQKYSATIADYYVQESYDKETGYLTEFDTLMANIRTQGLKTQVANLPTEGSATYSGKAFHGLVNTTLPQSEGSNSSKEVKASGNMSYTVNFANKTGSGKIIGLGDQIILEPGQISGAGISSTAKQDNISGSYSLDFFGKEAEEIGGKVSFDQKDSLSFGGSRGEIKK